METLNELIAHLTRQKLLLERMLYRAVTVRAMVLGGHARFLAWAAEDLDRAQEKVAAAEVRRDALYTQLRGLYDLPEEFSFDALLLLTSEPMTTLLATTRSEMAAVVSELRSTLEVISEQAHAGQVTAEQALARLQGVDLSEVVDTGQARAHIDTRL